MLGLLTKRFASMPGQFRSNVWDPVLILGQIMTMQCYFYTCYGLWLKFFDIIARFDISMDQMLTHTDLTYLEDSGFANMLTYACNSLTGALGLWLIVGRTKQCLDFSATVHFMHLIVTWIFNQRIPGTLNWYILNISSMAVMTILGEYLCMRSEMKAIPIKMGSKVDL